MEGERTPLRHENVPQYVFLTNYNRQRKNRIRRFQCCVCATLLAVFITTLVITVSYSINHDNEDSNQTTPNSSAQQNLLLLSWPLPDENYTEWEEPLPSPQDVALALEAGQKNLLLRESYEEKLPLMLIDTPSFRHQISTKTLPKARELSESGVVMNLATYHLYERRKNKTRNRNKPIGRWRVDDIQLLPKEICENNSQNPCEALPYRSADGSCNNFDHPRSWGVAMRPFRRHLLPDYSDGISAPREASDGSTLPSAREISVTVHRPYYTDDPNFTVMLAVWGQFIDHDMTATALSQTKDGNPISCCFAYQKSGLKQHPECYPVSIKSPDPFYRQYNVTCMEFVRSAASPICSFGPREQMNQASSFLDGSVVYGASDTAMSQLRTHLNGELKALIGPNGEELLPVSTDLKDGCNREEEYEKGRYCFLSGDPRSNENIHLTSLHLLFSRQHNQIARKLAILNPNWDDEKIFQETRKIIAAEIQHITYHEFLPVVIQEDILDQLNISLQPNGYFNGYNSSIDPRIANGFAASAFRFGHSLLPNLLRLIANDTSSPEYVELHKMLFNPFGLFDPNFLEQIVKGALDTPVEKVDPYVNEELTQHLFQMKPNIEKPRGPCGLDLVSLNIQRGRDHGLPGYPEWREHCGLEKPKSFDDLEGKFDPDTLGRVRKIYKTVDDIDMYTGALAEIPIEGGLVGPTVTCIITDQFLRLKFGDRFWYETEEKPQAFTPEQLAEIRKTTLARIICDTSGVDQAQLLVMRKAGEGNERKSCDQIPKIDLNKWKENQNNSTSFIGNTVKMFTNLSRVKVLKSAVVEEKESTTVKA